MTTAFAPFELINGLYSGKNGATIIISVSWLTVSALITEIRAGAAPQVINISPDLTLMSNLCERSSAIAALVSSKPAAME